MLAMLNTQNDQKVLDKFKRSKTTLTMVKQVIKNNVSGLAGPMSVMVSTMYTAKDSTQGGKLVKLNNVLANRCLNGLSSDSCDEFLIALYVLSNISHQQVPDKNEHLAKAVSDLVSCGLPNPVIDYLIRLL